MSSRDARVAGSRLGATGLSDHPHAIFINGTFITADAEFSVANAVAVRDGRFLAVGNTEDIKSLAGPSTEVIDLHLRMVMAPLQRLAEADAGEQRRAGDDARRQHLAMRAGGQQKPALPTSNLAAVGGRFAREKCGILADDAGRRQRALLDHPLRS